MNSPLLRVLSMLRAVTISFGVCCLLLAVGCGQKSAPMATVSGKVNLDGKPLPEGEITFLGPGGAPIILPIKDGAYSGKVAAGKNRVEIRAYKAGPPMSTAPNGPPTKVNYLPERYSGQSKLEADVAPSGGDIPPFEITSR